MMMYVTLKVYIFLYFITETQFPPDRHHTCDTALCDTEVSTSAQGLDIIQKSQRVFQIRHPSWFLSLPNLFLGPFLKML